MKLIQIKSLKNAGVWKSFSSSDNLRLSTRNLVFGFNGSGKTTLSRVFSSLQYGTIESNLPENVEFEIVTSNGSEKIITEKNISSDLCNSIAVYNTDFVSKNFLWNDGNIEGVIYLSERSIDEKNHLDKIREEAKITKKEKEKLEILLSEIEERIHMFYRRNRRNIRELVPSKTDLTRYSERLISDKYTKGNIDSSKILSSEELHSYQSILAEHESLFHIQCSLELPLGLFAWLEESNLLISQHTPRIQEPEFRDDPRVIRWVTMGIEHHERHNSLNCFFCGNSYPYERHIYLNNLPGIHTNKFLDSLRDNRLRGQRYQEELENFVHSIPKMTEIIPSKREDYLIRKERFIKEIGVLRHHIGKQIRYMMTKSKNPSSDLSPISYSNYYETQKWFDRYAIIVESLQNIISQHNDSVVDIGRLRRHALVAIESHVFASSKSEWDELYYKYNYLNNKYKNLEAEHLATARIEDRIKKRLKDQRVGEDEMNKLLSRYLGHKEIRLVAHGGGYNIRRSNGELATKLSEGERSAISFCYFLAELSSVSRDTSKLVVIIDDPVSSLDTIAQTHAMGVMNELTEKCAQVILLTHSSSFTNMVRRSWSQPTGGNGPKPKYLFLDCRISEKYGDRRTKLTSMPPILKDYDNEYHYLFGMVYEAAKSKTSDRLFFLPNAIRKMLEIFVAFHYPDKRGFRSVLDEQRKNLDNISIYYALYSLMNSESHGTVKGLTGHADLTFQGGVPAAEAAIEFIRSTNEDHYRRMKTACKVGDEKGNGKQERSREITER